MEVSTGHEGPRASVSWHTVNCRNSAIERRCSSSMTIGLNCRSGSRAFVIRCYVYSETFEHVATTCTSPARTDEFSGDILGGREPVGFSALFESLPVGGLYDG